MRVITTTEMKIQKTRLNTFITAAETQEELDGLVKSKDGASRLMVFSHLKPSVNFFGLRHFPSKPNARAIDILRQYVVQIPGNEFFIVANPDVIVTEDQSGFMAYLGAERMQVSWASYVMDSSSDVAPIAFVMSAPVLPHLLRDMPEKFLFSGVEWRIWMHQWLKKFMLQHRYFDATGFGFVIREQKVQQQQVKESLASKLNPFKKRA